MKARTLLGLIVCNLIWSANPAMAKIMLNRHSPAAVAWLRYFSAFAFFCALALLFPLLVARLPRLKGFSSPFLKPRTGRDAVLIIILAFMTFCFSPVTQMTGLAASRATDNALIVAMEPLITVCLAWVFLRESLSRTTLFGIALAVAGFVLLSGVDGAVVRGFLDSQAIGNLVILASLFGEACYSVIARQLMMRYSAPSIFGSGLGLGVVFLTIALSVFSIAGGTVWTPGFLAAIEPKELFALFWLGPVGTTLTYIFWMVALAEASVGTIALTLFIQPVFGALWGHWFLTENLTFQQGVGAVLILLALFSQTVLTPRAQAVR